MQYICGLWAILTLCLFPSVYGTDNCTQVSVATAVRSTCILKDCNVWCWGYGGTDYGCGPLGNGRTADLSIPPANSIDLGSDFEVGAVNCGTLHCCGVSLSKTMKCWGWNYFGQLGQGDVNNRGDESGEMGDSLSIIDLGPSFDVDQVSCGDHHVCVLSTDNEIKCFGHNDQGQLGYGNTADLGDEEGEMGTNLSAVSLGADFTPIQVECGLKHSCALSDDYQVKCWGFNREGQLGQEVSLRSIGNVTGQMGDNLTPIDLGSNFDVTSIRCGAYHTCAMSQTNKMKCWGQSIAIGLGNSGNKGDQGGEMGDFLDELTWNAANTGFVPLIMSAGDAYTLVLSTDGTLIAWGWNALGQLGYGDTTNRELANAVGLIDVGDGYVVSAINSGTFNTHSCALLENGTDFMGLKCWGQNDRGQLGLGDTEYRGDDPNEMGSYLPFVIPALPTPSPTEQPTVDPTNEPTSDPTSDPSIDPTSDPTTEPTSEPTTDPTAEPTINPTLKPSTMPTMGPTTICEPQQECTECLDMNSVQNTSCLWHIDEQQCQHITEVSAADLLNDAAVHDVDMCPTDEPTISPTDDPTAPTDNPTNEPTTPSCTAIYVDIVNFNEFTATQLAQDVDLQNVVANATRYSISDISSDHGIGYDAFNVLYEEVSGTFELVGEQLLRSLSIEQLLCVFDGDESNDMILIIDQEKDEISASLTKRLTVLYPEEDEMEQWSIKYSESESETVALCKLWHCY